MGYSVVWVGVSGLKTKQLVGLVLTLVKIFGIPSMLLIHCGGNDIGYYHCHDLIFHMTFAIYCIHGMLPGTQIIFSSILPRGEWRYSENNEAMEESRKRVNRGIRKYMIKNNSYVLYHPDFNDSYKALFHEDKVHLSFVGKDIFINSIQEALLQFVRYPNKKRYPMV